MFAFNSQKTTDGNTYFAINTHQPLDGPVSWYEAHLCSEEGTNILGALFAGSPNILTGTNENLAWTHTVNEPDKTDVFALEMHPKEKLKYRVDENYLSLIKRKAILRYSLLGIPNRIKKKFYNSIYGPTLKNKSGFYAVRTPILFDIRALNQWWLMNKAKNFSEFYKILKKMDGLPVTVRLLDPPLHEFINIQRKEMKNLANDMGLSLKLVEERVESLKEANPMLGHRGCRLGVSYPEVTSMQAHAIIGAAVRLKKEGKNPKVELMIPLVSNLKEFLNQKNIVLEAKNEIIGKSGLKINLKIGTMIEVPRACLVAEDIAKEADFFSFGTNDLTQTTFGFSRDDTGTFFPHYFNEEILSVDPFEEIDRKGVGRLMKMAVKDARAVKNSISIGICGEHGGEPKSIEFCKILGLDYVSCSPYRVPIARLAAAQVEI